MKIGIVASHHWPIPTPVHTGDIVILDLAIALTHLGHEVVCFAPEGTKAPGKLCPMQAALGSGTPSARDCEVGCFWDHSAELFSCDVVHDFSTEKNISEMLGAEGRPVVQTIMGGRWLGKNPPRNLCCFSQAHAVRLWFGRTDYHGTPTPNLAGPDGPGVKDARAVYAGIDTDYYCPSNYEKGGFLLWLNRWHPAKGYRQAIELAQRHGFNLVMAGERPSDMRWESEKEHAIEAVRLAGDSPNIRFEWLPKEYAEHHAAKRELYRRAKGLLYTVQFHEPFGLAMAEVMACGTPVLALDYGSIPELIGPAPAGRIASSLDGLMPAPVCSRAEYEALRNYAVERFDRKVMAANYVKEYERVIGGEKW